MPLTEEVVVTQTPKEEGHQPVKPAPEATAKPRKAPKLKLEVVQPTHIVEVWRLVEHSLRDGNQLYPDTTEDSRDLIRSHLFNYLGQPLFTGLLARIGKRPVGTILGHVQTRPYGRPSRFAFIYGFWVEPQFRGMGVGHALWNDYTGKLKKAGIYHWETLLSENLLKELSQEGGISVTPFLSVAGGRL